MDRSPSSTSRRTRSSAAWIRSSRRDSIPTAWCCCRSGTTSRGIDSRRDLMGSHRLALLSALLLAGLPAGAGIYRCTDAAGAVTYQEIPCPASSEGRATNLPTDFPEVDRAERDRLLQRADAAEARLLRR